ncbi:hypothetical protein IFT66_08730 [Rhizobium sp. CFBP 13726]|uniref:hypothetical protein n=1 Tax=Rhizobium sp. CFBP 13726 TaxID=2775296 RepID=UPI001781E657|nr:hypothetical protein [Rhizobium sp. CFBP 13726]MBD8651157.1 hypothetical protein [Rhizobium sp. CFBP 13726]
MGAKKPLTLSENDKEIVDFLHHIDGAGQTRVLIAGECYLVTVFKERVTDAGREFLLKGGRET